MRGGVDVVRVQREQAAFGSRFRAHIKSFIAHVNLDPVRAVRADSGIVFGRRRWGADGTKLDLRPAGGLAGNALPGPDSFGIAIADVNGQDRGFFFHNECVMLGLKVKEVKKIGVLAITVFSAQASQ